MNIKLFLALIGLWMGGMYAIQVPLSEKGERRIVVLAASYNNKDYYKKHLDSIFNQKYDNYHIVYIDDCSTDSTSDLVLAHAAQCHKTNKITVIKNDQRKGALRNQYEATHQCNPTDLIVILDGDDWFFDPNVLGYINKVYADEDIWMTYGQFIQYPTKDRGWNVRIPYDSYLMLTTVSDTAISNFLDSNTMEIKYKLVDYQ